MPKLKLETLCLVCESAALGDDEDDGDDDSDLPELELSSPAERPTIFRGATGEGIGTHQTRIARIITHAQDRHHHDHQRRDQHSPSSSSSVPWYLQPRSRRAHRKTQ